MEVGNFVKELGHGTERQISINLLQRGFCESLGIKFVVRFRALKEGFSIMFNDLFLNYNSVITTLFNGKNQSVHPLHRFIGVMAQVNLDTHATT